MSILRFYGQLMSLTLLVQRQNSNEPNLGAGQSRTFIVWDSGGILCTYFSMTDMIPSWPSVPLMAGVDIVYIDYDHFNIYSCHVRT